jgi:hypothetical protein
MAVEELVEVGGGPLLGLRELVFSEPVVVEEVAGVQHSLLV